MGKKYSFIKGEMHNYLLDLETLNSDGMEELLETAFQMAQSDSKIKDVVLIHPNSDVLVLQAVGEIGNVVKTFRIDELNRDKKTNKIKTALLRDPYYQLADGITSLRTAVLTSFGNPELIEVVQKLSKLNDELYEILERNYIWD